MDTTAPPITTLPEADKFCAVCKKINIDLGGCAKCRSICYCSKACQKADWNLHKVLCNAFANTARPVARDDDDDKDSRPYKRCILFDAKKDAPEIFWVRAHGNQTPIMDRLFTRENYQSYLRGEFCPMAMIQLHRITEHNTKGNSFLTLFSNKAAPVGNPAVTAAARRIGEGVWGTYNGSTFLVRQSYYNGRKLCFEDVTPAEFRAAVHQLSQKLLPDMVALQQEMGQQAFDRFVCEVGEKDHKTREAKARGESS
ncbi:hypothetical protein N0V93_008147 [Gnomoniopsis smithogilvyi]|uniref:MYND-type domain-containing protein n=1 Tax=Gnomoniopsis smithogilvyi TaxID=1191159 RepID=A0A9W8YPT0_9PEZI|nr:hypothetical protein N0V93_008147 [Gnomoniopsis smithogilvyi]